jgi:hypothetical protein
MSHYARVNSLTMRVEQVIVADFEFVSKLPDFDCWVKTSYNTHGGVHYGQDGQPDDGEPLRKNFAGKGMIYDPELDAFYDPQPFPSWTLNTETCLWEPPVARPAPDEFDYYWDEESQSWMK